ncbi:MAG: precorrin-6y C5,15-methyltransferase (decarboxylating) subunit CbiE [Desulfobaccales bacterium]|nr:precorrin-6y C5,15-methyltransferase (decarboxylating) subunit CbiE [Desulfobaccales bacterium]
MIPVQVVGLGMSPVDLTPRLLKIIAEAQVLVGGRRLLGYFPDHPAVKIPLGKDLEETLRQIPALSATQRVVVLASGDPNFYGVGPLVVKLLAPGQVVLHPNITAVQAACARLKISWEDAAVVSLHGRSWGPLETALQQGGKLIIYTDPEHTPAAIARFLRDRGLSQVRLCVLENLGQETERFRVLSTKEAQEQEFSPLNLVVVLPESAEDGDLTSREPGRGAAVKGPEPSPAGSAALHLGLPEAALVHEGGLITKAEVRAVVLAKLQLHPGQVLWDVGAGCGSVALEASLLLPGGHVLAVEQNPARAAQIRLNRQKYQVVNLKVICGQAPGCLEGLPSPQRVFVGGGGRGLPEIIKEVIRRLGKEGRVVLTATLLQTLEMAQEVLGQAGWEVEVIQLQVSRLRPLGEGTFFQALNPVWIITGCPKGG